MLGVHMLCPFGVNTGIVQTTRKLGEEIDESMASVEDALQMRGLSPEALVHDRLYEGIKRGLFYILQANGKVERICSDEDIAHAVEHPPQTTRAKLRGDFIRRAKERNRDYTVDWVHLKLNDQAQRTVLCKDPFVSTDDRVQKLIESL